MKANIDWKKKLTQEQHKILREKGTETAFTGKYYHHDESGIYRCAGCGQELFTSESKYDSGSGWPSFFTPMAKDRIRLVSDESHGMHRTEVICSRCGGHLGHVFEDGPGEHGGKRFCINSASLDFKGK